MLILGMGDVIGIDVMGGSETITLSVTASLMTATVHYQNYWAGTDQSGFKKCAAGIIRLIMEYQELSKTF